MYIGVAAVARVKHEVPTPFKFHHHSLNLLQHYLSDFAVGHTQTGLCTIDSLAATRSTP
jgi:hypothetical protein